MTTNINTAHMTTREMKELAMSMFPGSLWATYPDGFMSLILEQRFNEVTDKLNEFAQLIASRIVVDDEMIRQLETADECDPEHPLLFNLYFDVTDDDGRSLSPVWDIDDNKKAVFHCWHVA